MTRVDAALDLLAGVIQCARCQGRRFSATGDGLTCVTCGHALALFDGVLHAPRDGEDPAIDRERRAVLVPDVPGESVLDVDLVHEGITWFADRGVAPSTIALHVRP